MATLVLEFKKIMTKHHDIDDVFELICSTIISNIQVSLGQGSGWIIVSVKYNVNISMYNTLAGSSYVKFPEELDHPRKS